MWRRREDEGRPAAPEQGPQRFPPNCGGEVQVGHWPLGDAGVPEVVDPHCMEPCAPQRRRKPR
eukprot:9965167-Alexandrium_andersonii.AAC.1